MRKFLAVFSLVLSTLSPSIRGAEREFKPRISPDTFDFGTIGVKDDIELEHTFTFQNESPEPLEIKDVQLSPPLIVTKMTARVEPGSQGSVTIRLQKPHPKGEFEGASVVNFKNGSRKPLVLHFEGKIVPPIDFLPFAMFFVSTDRGQPKTAAIEVVNHEAEPLEIIRVEHNSSRFMTDLETLEAGKRYRLSLTLKGDGPAGKMVDVITLVTSSHENPFIEIKANTNIKERVYSFPESIDLGAISTEYLKARPQMASFLSQTIMVYQTGGKDFQITASTDVPFLRLETQRSELKDRYGIQISIAPEKLKSGEAKGSIVITTNDETFPRLVIPVSAVVAGNW